jgi:hypothetical protein
MTARSGIGGGGRLWTQPLVQTASATTRATAEEDEDVTMCGLRQRCLQVGAREHVEAINFA